MARILRRITYFVDVCFDYNSESIINKVKEYKYISFDIYDTLIKRSIVENKKLLKFAYDKCLRQEDIQTNLHVDELVILRNLAEKRAHSLDKEGEPTLDEIYELIAIDTYLRDKLKEYEIKEELELSYSNPIIREVYEWCIKNNKKIIAISDMYLSLDTIKNILYSNGYNQIERIFISSDVGYSKSSGKLFDYVLQQLSIDKKDIVHVGDSLKADYFMAKKKGLNCIHIARYPIRTKYTYVNRKYTFRQNWEELKIIMSGHITGKWNDYFQYGYEVNGPLLLGFALWLKDNFKRDNIHTVCFMARDGFLPQQVFSVLFPNEGINVRYLYVSRRALRLPTLYLDSRVDRILELFPQNTTINLNDFCNSLNLNCKDIHPYWVKAGLNNDFYDTPQALLKNEKFNKFINLIQVLIKAEAEKAYKIVTQFLDENSFAGNVALVDIGWKGTIQKCLQKLSDSYQPKKCNFFGYYLGLSEDTPSVSNFKSYIARENNPQEFDAALIEFPFLAPEGSLKYYFWDSKKQINFELSNYEYEIVKFT